MGSKSVFYWEIAGVFFIIGYGILLHFTYDWSNQSSIVGVFSPINESIWEHLKIAYFPLVLFSFIEYFFIREKTNNFFLAKALGVLAVQLIIVGIFYTYTMFTNKPFMVIDISSYILGVIICQIISYKILTKTMPHSALNLLGLGFLLLNGALFMYFTFNPPQGILFQEPSTYLEESS